MRDQLMSVQILRAVAALMVVVFHVAQSWTNGDSFRRTAVQGPGGGPHA
jgi:peptidoglycan/LPS O-acetylase OafA/YrhL